jgi:hypothetical protein
MIPITSSVKFDQELWNVRSEGYCQRADDETTNPYLPNSTNWAAWEAGRAFGLGRVSQARGCNLNIQTDHGNYRVSFDELKAAPTKVSTFTYCTSYHAR